MGKLKKVLFLPLLLMPSGHHQVAEALMDMLKGYANDMIVEKIDLLSYTNKALEKMITQSYLNWIRYAPDTYDFAYKNFFYAAPGKDHSFRWYQTIFLKKMEHLLKEKKADLLVCTHAFPSYLISKLKMSGQCDIPVINVYTDFFINNLWGREGIDIHFLPSQQVKKALSEEYQISSQKLIVTGIPVHEKITMTKRYLESQHLRLKVLIAGGNSGLGGILKLLNELQYSTKLDYLVLCGNNRKLFDEIQSLHFDHIKPLPFLSSRAEMNQLYESVGAIVTKPGGVTISEAIRKRLPIFIHSVLPGQEEINLAYLRGRGLVFELDQENSLETQLLNVLEDRKKMKDWEQAVQAYQEEIELDEPEKIVDLFKAILNKKGTDVFQVEGA